MDIDEDLYSRQLYVLGHDAMKQLTTSNVLISGINGLGTEIAKNIILCGVNSITLHDLSAVRKGDIGTMYFTTEDDIGNNRAIVTSKELTKLNPYVKVNTFVNELTEEIVKQFNVVILVNSSLKERLRLNEITRNHKIHFITATSNGLFGQIFCDFNEEFIVNDVDGEHPHTSIIESITHDKDDIYIIRCVETEPHELTNDDYITFKEIKGIDILNNIKPINVKVIDKLTLKVTINDIDIKDYIPSGVIVQVKIPKILNFKSLKESIKHPNFVITNHNDENVTKTLHAGFLALDIFIKGLHRAPLRYSNADAKRLIFSSKEIYKDIDEDIIRYLSYTSDGQLTPIHSIIGGIVAQEALKACSHKFHPIYQWLYFDGSSCFTKEMKGNNTKSQYLYYQGSSRYDSQIAVFGRKFQDVISNINAFIVGAGAIGCELLKILAMMGLGSGINGSIFITDMDKIEQSNLNRQFLFRKEDIGKSKSLVASNKTKQMNKDITIRSKEDKMCPETENIYTHEFYNEIDIVINALDNVEARLYMDSQCIWYEKPLFESGTLGTKGNTQVIIPHMTESYASTRDPSGNSIPMCTLKNFPYNINHTIEWARDEFEELFTKIPNSAKQYLEHGSFLLGLDRNESYAIINDIKALLFNGFTLDFNGCIEWAINHWYDKYNYQIKTLLKHFPVDMVTDEGTPYWSGTKKCPIPLEFNVNDDLHMDYVITTAILRALNIGVDFIPDKSYVKEIISKITIQPSTDNEICVVDSEDNVQPIENKQDINIEEEIQYLMKNRNEIKINVTSIPFEKDDDNGHVDFITYASNLRALNYGIEPVDHYTTKGIAGRIIPAISTTTSVVAGLVGLEIYKVLLGIDDISQYQNWYLNLAIPFFTFTEPGSKKCYEINGINYSFWDHFMVYDELTIEQFIQHFKEKYNIEIGMILYDSIMIYSEYISKHDKERRYHMYITHILEEITGKEFDNKVITLSILADNLEEDIELPLVKYMANM